ncbi:properdin-like, partial [Diretmus argenteus]
CVRCFSHFDLASGQCQGELGEVEDEDDCCQNPQYGFQANGGCMSCGPPVWSPWSPWSPCNVLCGEGVRQRSRKCFGVGQSKCSDAKNNLQTEPCTANCCDEGQWGPWLPWSSCSVSCGGGVKERERVCSTIQPECHSTCNGSVAQTETCGTTACPGDGGVAYPTRTRHRSCSSPAPSSDTVPPGNSCPGDGNQSQDCSEIPNCPVDGSWGEWLAPGPCSVSCGEGLQISIRKCDNPAPAYSGKFCEGPSTRTAICRNTCPVDGSWSGWSSWGDCASSCIPEGRTTLRTRYRSCSNPAPSSNPPGKGCPGDNTQTASCDHLPPCPVDGVWGSWGPFTSCSVTCGVGHELSIRRCDNPAPNHGGKSCAGAESRTSICKTNVHCPVDGIWSEWSPWGDCRHPDPNRKINCKTYGGSQTRQRHCLFRAHNGSICTGGKLTDRRVCYDINRCDLPGTWAGWGDWTFCIPSCGGNSKRSRLRICKPNLSNYP